MVIDGVEKPDRRVDQLVVTARPQFRPEIRMIGGDSFPGPGKKGEEGGAIVPGEVETVIEFAERQRDPIERAKLRRRFV